MFKIKIFTATEIDAIESEINKFLSNLNVKTELINIKYQASSLNHPLYNTRHTVILIFKENV